MLARQHKFVLMEDSAGMKRLNRFSASWKTNTNTFWLKTQCEDLTAARWQSCRSSVWPKTLNISDPLPVARRMPTNSKTTFRRRGATRSSGSLYRHHTGTQQGRGSEVKGAERSRHNNPHQTLLTPLRDRVDQPLISRQAERKTTRKSLCWNQQTHTNTHSLHLHLNVLVDVRGRRRTKRTTWPYGFNVVSGFRCSINMIKLEFLVLFEPDLCTGWTAVCPYVGVNGCYHAAVEFIGTF